MRSWVLRAAARRRGHTRAQARALAEGAPVAYLGRIQVEVDVDGDEFMI